MPRKPKGPPKGYKKDGRVDLRYLPEVKIGPLAHVGAEALALQVMHSEASGDPPGKRLSIAPDAPPYIEIDPRYSGVRLLENYIHEAIHLACPWMWEHVVTPVARFVARVVWRAGYRLPEDID